MNTAHARAAAYDLLDEDRNEEVSSIRQITLFQPQPAPEVDPVALDDDGTPGLDLEHGVEINAHRLDRGFDDPTPVYATPYIMISGRRCDFPRGYYLGTRFETGVIESDAWEQEIRDAGAHEIVIESCRRYLSENAL